MNAGFGWVDFSNEQRNRVHSVIDMLSEGGTVDELGIGSVRDAIADWLFPGVSTIQTRPKYFIILVDIFLTYLKSYQQKQKLPSLVDYLRSEENRVMRILAKNYEYVEGNGVIGITVAREPNGEVARKPSSIYWNGLRIHNIIDTELSLGEYLKQNDLAKIEFDRSNAKDGSDDAILLEEHFSIKANLFSCINDDMTMELSRSEADFLKDKYIDIKSDVKRKSNLLGQLFTDERIQIINNLNTFNEMAEALMTDEDLMPETKNILKIAVIFNFLMHGAHIRYNIKLHEKAGNMSFEEEWQEWIEQFNKQREDILALDFDFVFTEISPRTDTNTQSFMRRWQSGVLKDNIDIEELDRLIFNQEVSKKGNKAKLASKSDEFDAWVGIRDLQYRYDIVKNIVKDIDTAYA
jgi:hypothetical protein